MLELDVILTALKKDEYSKIVIKSDEDYDFNVRNSCFILKKGDLLSRRKTISTLQDNKMSKKVFDVFADRYKNRAGGYTRIIKLGNRFGDNAPTAVIEFVDRDENAKGLDSGPVVEKKSTQEVEEQPTN